MNHLTAAWAMLGSGSAVYHSAPRRVRNKIEREGLVVGTPSDDYDPGVYFANSRQDMEEYLQGGGSPNRDIWRVDVGNFTLMPDPMYDGASYIEEAVPPGHLSLVGGTTSDGEVVWVPQ